MTTKEILLLAAAQGALVGSPYEKGLVIAQNVEGTITPSPNGGWRFSLKDEAGELNVTIASSAFVAGKTKYDLVVATATRDVALNNGTIVTKKGDKRLRAM